MRLVLGISCLVLAVTAAARAAAPEPLGSTGKYSHGALDGGVPMPDEGPGHALLFPARCYATPAFAATYPDPGRRENTWGNAATVAAVLEVTAAVHAAFPDAPKVPIGELSNRVGGEIPLHLSHQNGLDVDVVFMSRAAIPTCTPYGQHPKYEAKDAATGAWGVTADYALAWNWALAAAFAARRDVQAIFVGELIEKALGDWAKREGIAPAERRLTLAKLMPVRCSGPKGVTIDSYRNNFCPHDDHFHVRFKCPRGDRRCVGPRA